MTLCAKQPKLPALAHGRKQQLELKGCLWQKRAASETPVYLFSYSLPNQYQKQQKTKAQGRHRRTYVNANKRLFSGGRELEHATNSSSYLSLSALALNECSSSLGHITFVLYQSLWTAERYWASFDHGIRLNFKSEMNPNTHSTSRARSSTFFSHYFVCLFSGRGEKRGHNQEKERDMKRKSEDVGARRTRAL